QYETSDLNIKQVVKVGVISIVLLALSMVFVNEWFTYERERLIYEMTLKPESKELKALRQAEKETLENYKLLDSATGTYQIPIEEAIKLTATDSKQAGK
ncbi:MAG: hypothetical protein IIB00_10810, partial [candidate division Zixibacteria bacterium]|nr:hypothetical protein [candidate division Zixibacteria bacterium]